MTCLIKYGRAFEAVQAIGFNPIKLNIVALKGFNEDEFTDFAKLTRNHPFHIRFIEYMPIGRSRLEGRGSHSGP